LRWVQAWDRHERLRAVALQDGEAARLLAGMGDAQRLASWHLVTEDGKRYSAGRALAPLLELLPGGAPVARLARAFPSATDAGYASIVRHRSRLSRATKLLRR
jgi:predicted DCC family thiol-disulfide oxidoreductase YuxK